MKKLIVTAISAALCLSACNAAQPSADVAELKADVEELKLEVFGDPNLKCAAENVIVDPQDYTQNASDIPDVIEDLAEWHRQNGERDNVFTTETGLQYTVVKNGNEGAPTPTSDQIVRVHYHGYFPNGDVFDSSYNRGEPIEFPVTGVISGWIEALQKMKPCDAWTLYIPSDLAYGPSGRGSIPPSSSLLFNVQLLEIKNP